jgi:hypothetical protein
MYTVAASVVVTLVFVAVRVGAEKEVKTAEAAVPEAAVPVSCTVGAPTRKIAPLVPQLADPVLFGEIET